VTPQLFVPQLFRGPSHHMCNDRCPTCDPTGHRLQMPLSLEQLP
jgi:hypothetical protein